MKILEHRALRGPNYHSLKPVVYMRLDIGALEDLPSDRIAGFTQRLLQALPGLRDHRCSPGYPGGFVERLERGTWAAHIVEHAALELQTAAGMPVGFGKTRETNERGVYSVVYRYRDETAGLLAGRDAVDIVDTLVARKPVDVGAIIERLRRAAEENALGPSTRCIVDEALRRGIPVTRLDDGSYIQLGHGARQRRMQATMTDATSAIGMEIADDKDRTKRVLASAGIPVPRGESVSTWEDAVDAAGRVGYPLVVKPLVGNHGRGITTNVRGADELRAAFDAAKGVHRRVVIETQLEGADFRLLLVNHELVAAARRDHPQVVGDGSRTIRQLVERLNADPRRGAGHERVMTRVTLDADAEQTLAKQGLTLDDVPSIGRIVRLKSAANISAGGAAADVTDEVHPQVRAVAERASRIVGLDITGIDLVAQNIRQPLHESGGGIVEVNAAPGFRMHIEPSEGKPRNVAAPVLDMLFAPGTRATIPIVAVTGTNGKTTTVRLIAHTLRLNGARVGMTTTSGVDVQGRAVLTGDYSGPTGAQTVLRDTTVDHAVVEVARGGILRRGLGFDACDVSVLLNVANDHLGEGEIETVEDLARLKCTILEVVKPEGTAVLNAEDAHVMRLRRDRRCRAILFALDASNPELHAHIEDGGMAVTVRHGAIVLYQGGGAAFDIVNVRDVPITLGGVARFNVQNVLAAVAACHALGVPDDVICMGLTTFNPTAGQLPGRLNLFEVNKHRVLVDYGHNVAALRALSDVLPAIARRGRIINVANGSGNRRDEDLIAMGETLASMYHHVVLCDPDPRGRAPGETADLIRDGLRRAGFPDTNLQLVSEESEAIEIALDMAREGDLVVLQADDVEDAIRRVRARQAREVTDAASAEVPAAPEAEAHGATPRADDLASASERA